jgi:hypothetical protein
MSANARLLWIIPFLVLASWFAVRSLAASPAPERMNRELGDPPVPVASLSSEVRDPALQRFIGALAANARRN